MSTNTVVPSLKTTEWLAQRLGVSVTTIERLRAQNSPAIPKHVNVGHSIRYSEEYVERWIAELTNAVHAVNETVKENGNG
jgi:predicted DNA-binding transcriptional regulator AlpA